jgi:hypothetical protein
MPNPVAHQGGSWYEIRIEGALDDRWAQWVRGSTLTTEADPDGNRTSSLTVRVPDQAALRGLLNKMWDLNLTLVCVRRIAFDPLEETDHGD